MDTNTPSQRPSLFKQLLGAVGGAAIALVIYQGYSITAPVLTAWLVAPQSQIAAEHPGAVRVNQDVDEYTYNRVAARAQEIYQRFAAEPGPQAAVLPEGIEVTQPAQEVASSVPFVDSAQEPEASSVPEQEVVAPVVKEPTETASSSAETEVITEKETVVPAVQEEADAAESARVQVAQARASKLAGKNLPQSGVGTAVAVIMALGATAVVRRRKR